MIRKTDILAILAMIVFAASCTKIEQTESSEAMPISYQVIKDIQHTKAGELEYNKSIPFMSFAFYLPEGKFWSIDKNDAVPYFENATISYDSTEDKWKDQSESYYWPKVGSLSFFSWSPASIPDSQISVDITNGVCLTDWNTASNPAVDFLVADPVYDKISNETSYFYNGVPTLFRHQLAKISFHAHLEMAQEGRWTRIKKLYLTNIYAQADFRNNNWENREILTSEWVIYESSEGILLKVDTQQIGSDTFMIPQNLTTNNPKLVIIYDNEEQTGISKTFDFDTDINSYVWAKGTKTRYSISYGTSDKPIDFDTDVDAWTEYNWTDGGGNGDINIGDI